MRILLSLFICIFFHGLAGSQIYNDYIGTGHNEGVIVSSSTQQSNGQATIDGSGFGKDLAGASRLMAHATLGANLEEILQLDEMGYESWLEEQMELPATSYGSLITPIDDLLYEYHLELGGDPDQYFVTAQHFRYAWSHIIMNAPDVLRHRVALALSEIFVISDNSDLIIRGEGLADYYDLLSEHAFGNYRDLLMGITRHPTMGFYLGHLHNPKSDPANNIHPDENYAREIMQLFSIGLYELNNNGTRIIGSNNQAIPTYDNDDIKGLARVFTGFGAGAWVEPGPPLVFNPQIPMFYIDMTVPMNMYEEAHEPGEKHILGDFVIPAGQTGMQDVEMALDQLFNHPNVGPFLGTLLIKRLVKSNPTQLYVERVANAFNDNGNGVRGDLGAVIKAILLDEEARDCNWINNPSNGKLKEPIHRYTQYLKGLNVTADNWFWSGGYAQQELTGQYVLSSPTVFNFFLPDYQPNSEIANAELVAPEFQIFNSATSVGYMNLTYFMTVADFLNEVPQQEFNQLGILEDYRAYLNDPWLTALATEPEALVDYLDLILAHGNMSAETRQIIIDSTEPIIAFPEFSVKMALYLTMVSPDYAIMK
ncbi:MAG: DUF1800 domain-containing protein [Bacteroidota bacterium]